MPKQSKKNYYTVQEAKASRKPRVAVAPHIQFNTATEKYIVEFFSGWKPDGKAKRKFQTFDSLKEAERALTIHEAGRIESEKQKGMTVRELVREYIDVKAMSGQIAITTKEGYENLFKRISLHDVADISIKHIKPYDITNYVDELQKCGAKYSNTTIRKDIDLISSAFVYATAQGYIQTNPLQNKLIKPVKSSAQIITLNASDVGQIRDLLIDSEKYTLAVVFCLGVYQGLRRGECAGLKWSAINFDDNTIDISTTRTHVNTAVSKSPKTVNSCRKVYMHSQVRDILLRYRDRLASKKLLQEYVLISEKTGKPSSVVHLSEDFRAFMDKHTEFPRVTLHGLRHTYATEAIKHGADVSSVSRALEHSKISVTFNMYTHPDAKSSERVNSILENIF